MVLVPAGASTRQRSYFFWSVLLVLVRRIRIFIGRVIQRKNRFGCRTRDRWFPCHSSFIHTRRTVAGLRFVILNTDPATDPEPSGLRNSLNAFFTRAMTTILAFATVDTPVFCLIAAALSQLQVVTANATKVLLIPFCNYSFVGFLVVRRFALNLNLWPG